MHNCYIIGIRKKVIHFYACIFFSQNTKMKSTSIWKLHLNDMLYFLCHKLLNNMDIPPIPRGLQGSAFRISRTSRGMYLTALTGEGSFQEISNSARKKINPKVGLLSPKDCYKFQHYLSVSLGNPLHGNSDISNLLCTRHFHD